MYVLDVNDSVGGSARILRLSYLRPALQTLLQQTNRYLGLVIAHLSIKLVPFVPGNIRSIFLVHCQIRETGA